jgi:hypothetical protein
MPKEPLLQVEVQKNGIQCVSLNMIALLLASNTSNQRLRKKTCALEFSLTDPPFALKSGYGRHPSIVILLLYMMHMPSKACPSRLNEAGSVRDQQLSDP